ncbi:MAG: hypothetical protein LBR73_06490 [Oscillospiraceae bacterium]|jgi:hypothetical protein|nr:hypothetical protein [Oscillospiraceae bacterium]
MTRIHRRAKKTAALVLAAALSVSVLPTRASAAYVNPNGCTQDNPCRYSPTIIVPGINQSVTYLYENGERTNLGSGIIFPDGDQNYLPVIGSLLASILTRFDICLSSNIYKLLCAMLEPQRVDSTGHFVNDLRTDPIPRVSEMNDSQRHLNLNVNVPAHVLMEEIGEDHLYFYSFNLVDDIWNNVDGLEAFIDKVRAETGHDKVNLINVSLGGTVFTGYIEKYGHAKLDQVVNVVSCVDGSNMFADLIDHKAIQDEEFTRHVWLPEIVEHDIKIATGWDRTIGYALNVVLRILPKRLLYKSVSAAWQAILDTVILNCSQFLALIPRDRYDEIADKYLSGEEHAAVRDMTDRFHEAQMNLYSNIQAAVAAGVKVNNISGSNLYYGEGEYTFFRIAQSRLNSDGIIDLIGATMGATGAAPGETLPADYEPQAEGYLSPDGKIDASTALLPDNTWVFLDQPHEVGRNDAVLNLAAALLTNKIENIHSDPENYPQFNYFMLTNDLRRSRIAAAETLLADYPPELTAADREELLAAIAEGKAVRALTVGDAERAAAATQVLSDLLEKYGRFTPKAAQTDFQKAVEWLAEWISRLWMRLF